MFMLQFNVQNGSTLFHSCAITVFNTSRMITYLLETVGKREDVNLRDFNQRTPLHEAAYVGNIDVVQVGYP